jgi:hypothetical protein
MPGSGTDGTDGTDGVPASSKEPFDVWNLSGKSPRVANVTELPKLPLRSILIESE